MGLFRSLASSRVVVVVCSRAADAADVELVDDEGQEEEEGQVDGLEREDRAGRDLRWHPRAADYKSVVGLMMPRLLCRRTTASALETLLRM